MRDLTQHLTTRADDNHAPPVFPVPKERPALPRPSGRCQVLVRFFALLRIKPHAPLLVRVPVNSFEFHTCVRTLRRGLPGYLILFAPHAFVPQCQLQSRKSPSPPVFLLISTHFTATLGIPLSPPALKSCSSKGLPELSPGLSPHAYRTAYVLFTPNNSG